MKKWNDWVSREEFPRLFAPSLEIDLTAEYKGVYGDFTKTYHYDDAYLEVDGYNLKLISLDIGFRHSPPFSLETSIDFSKELIGVIEYLRSGKKTAVYKDRVTPDWRWHIS